MAKKRTRERNEDEQRRSRKEVLLARKEARQTRQIRIIAGIVGGLILLIILIAIINEFLIVPQQTIAMVDDEEISLVDWQDRVRYERAQRIISLENQFEAFDGNVGLIQQFSGQTIIELQDTEALGESVLDQMVDDVIVRHEAEERGITVTKEDVEEEIGAIFNYFDGDSPTPVPTPTGTAVPTPSLTPIPTAVITDVVPTDVLPPTPTLGPTSPPQPTPTPVSEEAFEEEFNALIEQFNDLGVEEETFREVIRSQLYRQKLADALAEERELPTSAVHASAFLLTFDTEEEANEAMAMIQEDGFLEVWNQIRSLQLNTEETTTASASEILWQTQDTFVSSVGQEIADVIFNLPPNVPSSPIEREVDAETTRYYIVQVSGREVRDLAEATVENNKTQFLNSYVAEQLGGSAQITELWRSRVPAQPVLDPKFLAPPTAVPSLPTPEGGQLAPTPVEEPEGGS